MYKEVSINISSFAVERSQVTFFFSSFMYKSKKPNVSSSTVRRHYNEDSEASVQSCSRHQKRNTNAMSFVHRVMNAACFCVCVSQSACVMCVRDWGVLCAEARIACVSHHLVAKKQSARSR